MQNRVSIAAQRPSGWRKSSYSGPQGGDCLEMSTMDDGAVAVRDSKDPGGPILVHSPSGMKAFIRGIKAGQLDGPAG